jgi:hypothetical protein
MEDMIRGPTETSEQREFLDTVYEGLDDLPEGSSAGLEDFERADPSTDAGLDDVDWTGGSSDRTLVVTKSGDVK